MRKAKPDKLRDNSPEGILRRSDYAFEVLKAEASIVAGDVGPLMTVATLLGVSMDIARDNGIAASAYQGMLIDILHQINHPETRPGTSN